MPILLGLIWCIILIFMWPSALGNMGYVPVKILTKNKNLQKFQRLSFSIINIHEPVNIQNVMCASFTMA